jgi:hypothetical protein
MPIDRNDPRLLIGTKVIATKRSLYIIDYGYDIGDIGVVADTPSYLYVDVNWENGHRHCNTRLKNIDFLSSDPADQLFN